ncbi:hypothetical protein H4R99_008301, partial [Coemansia sp. RSA 1722]
MSIFGHHDRGGQRVYNNQAQPGYVEPAQYKPGALRSRWRGGGGRHSHGHQRPEKVKVVKEKHGGCMPFLCGM